MPRSGHITAAAERREAERRAARERGEPTLPLAAELEGLAEEAQLALIAAAAREVVAWNRARARGSKPLRQLLSERARAELVRTPGGILRPCPWCGRESERHEPACLEHAELERSFLQAAGDGWG